MRAHIWALGAVSLVSFLASTVLSYPLSLVSPFGALQYGETAFFQELAVAIPIVRPLTDWAIDQGPHFADPQLFLLAYCAPLLVSSIVFLTLIVLLWLRRGELDSRAPPLLFWIGVGFAFVSAFAIPVVVDDFWWSVGWGRLVIAGTNPYYISQMGEVLGGTPLRSAGPMTYGPVWALITGAVMWLAQCSAVMGAILFKLLLACAWVGCLRLIWAVLKQESLWRQCIGLAIWGWLPLSVSEAVAEGHNDVVMVVLILLWLYRLEKGNATANVVLAVSVALKYAAAPLFLLDFLYHVRGRNQPFVGYALRGAAAAIVMALPFALFYRSPEFFAPMAESRTWEFFTPANAVSGLGLVLGGHSLGRLTQPIGLLFPVLAAYFVVRYGIRPSIERFHIALVALLSALVFAGGGHVWPWFALWALAPAALAPNAVVSRFVIGFACAAPFPILVWTVFPQASSDQMFLLPSLGWYASALALACLVPSPLSSRLRWPPLVTCRIGWMAKSNAAQPVAQRQLNRP
jgi:hypothetical protein